MPGGGKGGGGQVNVPKINDNPSIGTSNLNGLMGFLGDLSAYETQLLETPTSMGNWAANIATGGAASPANVPDWRGLPFGSEPYAYQTGAAGSTPGTFGGSGGGGGMGNFLDTAWKNILAQEANAAQMQSIEHATNQLNQGIGAGISNLENISGPGGPGSLQSAYDFLQGQQGFLNRMEQGQLMPGQQALIDEQVRSGQQAIASQLGAEGLTNSTQAAMLANEVAMSGAATAGQLEQGNVQLGLGGVQTALSDVGAAQNNQTLLQAGQRLGLAGQALSAQEQNQVASQLAAITGQAAGLQSQVYSQAMQGYGLLGQFLNSIMSASSLSMSGYQSKMQASEAQAQLQVQAETASLQAQAQQSNSMGSLFQGIGSLFGMGGGGGGGLLGGLFGTGAGAAGGAAALGLGSAGGSVMSGIGAVSVLAVA